MLRPLAADKNGEKQVHIFSFKTLKSLKRHLPKLWNQIEDRAPWIFLAQKKLLQNSICRGKLFQGGIISICLCSFSTLFSLSFSKMCHSWPLFFIQCRFYAVKSKKMLLIKHFWWLDSNLGPLVSEAIALITVTQPLDVSVYIFVWTNF